MPELGCAGSISDVIIRFFGGHSWNAKEARSVLEAATAYGRFPLGDLLSLLTASFSAYTANSERFFSLDATVGATFDQAFNPGTFRMGGDSDGIQLRIVPEPEEYALVVGLGLLAFAFVRKWRRRAIDEPAHSG